MNSNGLAYSSLIALLDNWAMDHPDLVRNEDTFAWHAADYAFNDLLGIDSSQIDNED